jgi:cbb3-type cytochrome oxidase subunit 3
MFILGLSILGVMLLIFIGFVIWKLGKNRKSKNDDIYPMF